MYNFRVLLVYVNSMMDNLIPLNISYLIACLKEKGIDVRLFDTTFYKTASKSSDESRVEMLQVKPFDLSKYGINYKMTDIFSDFRKSIIEYKPHLIGFSVVESTYLFSEKLLNSISDVKEDAKIIFGGIFPIFAYKKIIKHPLVDMVCYGEGEITLVEVCEALAKKSSLRGIHNLAAKENNTVFYNKKGSLVELESLPYLDFSLFEKERFFKPMGGKVLKMVPIEFARGCVYNCTYCASPALAGQFKENGRWYRQKAVRRIIDEIEFYLKRYSVEYFYFISETFLSISEKNFNEFSEYYKSIRIPFWCNSRIETITHDRLRKLEGINCNRISIGLESGSEYVRRNLLNRNYSNDYFVDKFKILKDFNIAISVNNIIGFPDETREQIFETIEMNRKIQAESFGAYIFQPYVGTPLRDYCIKRGYIPGEDFIAGDAHLDSVFDTPNMTGEEIMGLQRTFALYVKLPKEYYPEIKKAERFDEEGNNKFKELSEIYYKKYS